MKRPEINLAFSEMEIHYMKGGGWINTSVLDIDGTGEVKAYLIRHASSVILDSARMILNDSEKERLVELSSSFSTYEDYYQPDDYRTDQDDHSLVLILFVFTIRVERICPMDYVVSLKRWNLSGKKLLVCRFLSESLRDCGSCCVDPCSE